jgi:hypothetical protein
MMLRARRRTLVVFRQSGALAGSDMAPKLAEPTRARRRIRVGTRLMVIGLMHLARGARARWRPILAAAALIAASVMLGSDGWSLLYFGGIWYLLHAFLTAGHPGAERSRVAEPRRDLGATLDRYPDGSTRELRDILTIS